MHTTDGIFKPVNSMDYCRGPAITNGVLGMSTIAILWMLAAGGLTRTCVDEPRTKGMRVTLISLVSMSA